MKNPLPLSRPLIRWVLLLGLVSSGMALWMPDAQAASEAVLKVASLDSNWVFVGAALATGLSSLGAGFAVARVGTAAVGALAEKPELFGRLLIFIGLAEGIAIYGLIVSILMLNRLG